MDIQSTVKVFGGLLVIAVLIIGYGTWSNHSYLADSGAIEKAQMKRSESVTKQKAADSAYNTVLKSELDKGTDAKAAEAKAQQAKKEILGNS